MKKLWFLVVGALMMTVLVACAPKDDGDSNADKKGIEGNYVKSGVVLKDIEDKKTFVFAIVDKDCSACQAYKAGALKEFEEKDSSAKGSIRHIEINGIENDSKELGDIQILIDEHLDGQFEATPTTYFIKDGKMSEAVVGAITYDELLDKYQENIVEQNE